MKKVMEKAVKPCDRIKRWNVVRGDKVEITSGIDKGDRGTVLEVHRRWNTMLVSGCRLNKKRAHGPNGEKTFLFELESPVHYAHVHLIDPSDDKPCAVTYKFDDKGNRVRVSARTDTEIPKPPHKRRDFENKWTDYQEGHKDTKNAELLLRTYFPEKVHTFRETILSQQPPQTEYNYPPKHLSHMKRDRNRYPRVKKRFRQGEFIKNTQYINMEGFNSEFEKTIKGIDQLKAKDLSEYEKSQIRDAAFQEQAKKQQSE